MTPCRVGSFVLLLAIAFACGDREEHAGAARSGQPSPPAPIPSRWSDEPDPRPLVRVMANAGAEELVRGTPLVVELRVLHPRVGADAVPPVLIAAKEGAWSNALRVEIADERGAPQSWPLRLASEVSGPLSLDAESGGVLLFTLPAEETAALAEGVYRIRALLDTREAADVSAWRGEASAPAVALRVAATPTRPTAVQERAGSLDRARYQLALGDAARAEAEIDGLLRGDPDDLVGLLWKGDLLESAGRPEEALAVYEQALAAFWAAHPDSEEPPLQLAARRDALLRGLVRDE